jgi:hypothetical protein
MRGDAVQGVWGALRHVVQTEGYAGLYVGLRVSLVRVVPNCCVTFVSYELIARWVRGMMVAEQAEENNKWLRESRDMMIIFRQQEVMVI